MKRMVDNEKINEIGKCEFITDKINSTKYISRYFTKISVSIQIVDQDINFNGNFFDFALGKHIENQDYVAEDLDNFALLFSEYTSSISGYASNTSGAMYQLSMSYSGDHLYLYIGSKQIIIDNNLSPDIFIITITDTTTGNSIIADL